MVEMALLIAVILIMAFTPIGYIRTFGITSFIQCFGMSPFGAALLGINPIYTLIVCVLPRTLMGWLTGLLYQGFIKCGPLKKGALALANLCCPLLNTFFFMGTLVLFFYQTDYIQGIAAGLGAGNVLMFIVLFVGLNGLVEAAACFVAGSAVSQALKRVMKH